MKRRSFIGGLIILMLSVVFVVAACGGDEGTTTTAAPAETTSAVSTETTSAPSSETTSAPGSETTMTVAKEDVLKIGAISSVSGDLATAFKAMYDSVGPTQEILNEEGGCTVGDTHYTIELTMYDDQSTTAGGMTAISKLIGDGVKYVVPPMFMPINLAIAQTCEENKIMRVKSAGAGAAETNPENPYMFFSFSSFTLMEPFYEYALAKYPEIKKVAVITPDDPGAVTFEEMTKAVYAERGIEIVYWEVYPQPSFDFYSILNKALATNPDAIDMIFGIPPCTSAIINQSRELGFEGPIFSPSVPGDANVINAMLAPEWAYDILASGPEVMSDKMIPRVQRLREMVLATGASFEFDSLHLLDACSAIVSAIEAAQSIETVDVVAAIDSGACEGFDGSYGPATWGAYEEVYGNNHCAEPPAMVTAYNKGVLEFEWLK
ncbi:MAG: ABC transporter substrate-binding protein [Actinobacteria bacterium]|nr:ABC transporter substrate-binding protein [Actinomycetota bacterium]